MSKDEAMIVMATLGHHLHFGYQDILGMSIETAFDFYKIVEDMYREDS